MNVVNSPVIQIERGHKYWYAGNQAITILKDVNLTVSKGEVQAIVGPSGAGKSTLLHVLGFLTFLDKGDIRFENESVTPRKRATIARARPSIGFVFQDAKLIGELTVIDNVSLPLAHRGVWPSQRKKLAALELEKVGLENRLHHFPNQLSGGELMRAAIARALVQKPKVLLADEPTGNLDSTTGEIIADLLFENVSANHATVFVTHNLKLARRANRMVYLEDGEIKV